MQEMVSPQLLLLQHLFHQRPALAREQYSVIASVRHGLLSLRFCDYSSIQPQKQLRHQHD